MNRPLSFFGSPVPLSAGEGNDLLQVEGQVVRPKIGGKRGTRETREKHGTREKRSRHRKHPTRHSKRTRKHHTRPSKRTHTGGFYPSIMGNFIGASSKYIVPMALFAGYKLMTKKAPRGKHPHRV